MAKVRWTEARWAKRAQKARALAKNVRTPARRRMMLEMAEFYDRLANLTRDFKTAAGSPIAQPHDRDKVPLGPVRSLIGGKRRTLSIERKRPVGAARTSKQPQGKRHASSQDPTCECAVSESEVRQGMFANDQATATLEV